MAPSTPSSVSRTRIAKCTYRGQARDYLLCLPATVRGHSHSGGEGNSADTGGQLAEQQNLPQVNMVVVSNRDLLDKMLLF